VTPVSEESSDRVYSVYRLPESALKGISHPRLRRASAISRFAAAAGLHALESAGLKVESQNAGFIDGIAAVFDRGPNEVLDALGFHVNGDRVNNHR
jgi:hypothetical protein